VEISLLIALTGSLFSSQGQQALEHSGHRGNLEHAKGKLALGWISCHGDTVGH
jgi:hypothetical protein